MGSFGVRHLVWAALLVAVLHSACSSEPHDERLQVNGSRLFYEVHGEGSPIVVVHGGPGLNHRYLLPGLLELANTHRLIFYDQRGCGSSSDLDNPDQLSLTQSVSDLEGLRQELGIDHLVLMGHSFGTLIAMQYALEHPERVSRLILISPGGFSPEDWADSDASWQQRVATAVGPRLEEIRSSSRYQEGDPGSVEDYLRTSMQHYLCEPGRISELNLRMDPKSAQAYVTLNRLANANPTPFMQDLYPDMRKSQVRTLIIHGDCDVIPGSVPQRAARALPKADLVLLTDAGHFPWIESSELFFEEVHDFLEEPSLLRDK